MYTLCGRNCRLSNNKSRRKCNYVKRNENPVNALGWKKRRGQIGIYSFINSDDRERIPASGNGQTTRTSMEYSIDCQGKCPLSIEISLKSKEVFCAERYRAFGVIFKESYFFKNNKTIQGSFKQALIHDDAFFNCFEFECGEEIDGKYDELFTESFINQITEKSDQNETQEYNDAQEYYVPKEIYNSWKGLISEKGATESQNEVISEEEQYIPLEDFLKLFCEWVYEKCASEISEYLKKYNIELTEENRTPITNVRDIQRFIKTEQNKISFSSLIEKVFIQTTIAEYYRDLMNDIRIGKLIFVDTYGLNHDVAPDAEVIKERYSNLFREYPNMTTVIYIRAAQPEPPTDLLQNIPLLYEIKPSVISYIVFTKVDVAGNSGYKAIEEMKKPESRVYSAGVLIKLLKNNVNPKLAKLRIQHMADNVVEYCSRVGTGSEFDKYLDTNKSGIRNLFLSIRDKKHLGDKFVDIDKMSLDNMKIEGILDVKKIFSTYNTFSGYPSRTIGALGNRLQSGELGFYSSTWGNFKYWDDEIFSFVNDRFSTITNQNGFASYLDNEIVVPVVQQIFNEFIDLSIRCMRNPEERNINNYPVGNYCTECPKSCKEHCIQNVLYEAQKEIISSKYYPVSDWLTSIYDFRWLVESNGDVRKQVQGIFDHLYSNFFIASCRNNNARILASEISADMTEQEFEEKINNYFNDYDRNLDDDEKIKFEQMVTSELPIILCHKSYVPEETQST